jgi:hypothetical protein
VKALGISGEEAPSPHTQAVIDTQMAAAMEYGGIGRKMVEGHLLFYGKGHAGGSPGLTLKDQVNLKENHLLPPPRSIVQYNTVPELWGTRGEHEWMGSGSKTLRASKILGGSLHQ